MKHTDKTKLFGKLEYLPTDQYNEIYEKTQLDVDGRKKLLSEGKYEIMKMANDYVKFCKNIPFFSGLSLEDQKALLKCNYGLIFLFNFTFQNNIPFNYVWYGETYAIMFEFLRKAHYNYSTDINFVFNLPKTVLRN